MSDTHHSSISPHVPMFLLGAGMVGLVWFTLGNLPPISHSPPKVADKDIEDYLQKKRNDKNGALFNVYLEQHPDTSAPEFKLPEITVADPTMWDWTVRTFFLHQKLRTYWANLVTNDVSTDIALNPGDTLEYNITIGNGDGGGGDPTMLDANGRYYGAVNSYEPVPSWGTYNASRIITTNSMISKSWTIYCGGNQ